MTRASTVPEVTKVPRCQECEECQECVETKCADDVKMLKHIKCQEYVKSDKDAEVTKVPRC